MLCGEQVAHGAEQDIAKVVVNLQQQPERTREQTLQLGFDSGRGINAVTAAADLFRHRFDRRCYVLEKAAGEPGGGFGTDRCRQP